MNIESLDIQLLLFVNHGAANPFFDMLMPFLSMQGYLLVLPFLFYLFIVGGIRKDARGKTYLVAVIRSLVISCCALFIAEWTEYLLKNAIARTRPCYAIEGIRLLVACPESFSMPSGHAISSFAFAVPLFYLTREHSRMIWRLYPLLLATLIAFSRTYLGVHYPSDVLAGALLGTTIALLLSFLSEAWGRREPKESATD